MKEDSKIIFRTRTMGKTTIYEIDESIVSREDFMANLMFAMFAQMDATAEVLERMSMQIANLKNVLAERKDN